MLRYVDNIFLDVTLSLSGRVFVIDETAAIEPGEKYHNH